MSIGLQPKPDLQTQLELVVGFLSQRLPPGIPSLATTARTAQVYKAQRFSDHAPLTIDYNFAL